MPEDDRRLPHPQGPGGEHVVAAAHGEHGASQEPSEDRDLHDGDGEDDRRLARPRRQRGDRHGQQQRRDGEHHVDHAHDEGVHPAAEGPGQRAEGHAADQADDRGADAHDQRLLRPHEQSGEQVTAAVVGTEREAGLRPGDRVGLLAHLVQEQALGRVVRGDPGRDDREDHERQGDAGTDEEDGVAPQPAPGAGDERDPGCLLDLAGPGHGAATARRGGEAVDALLAPVCLSLEGVVGHGVTSSGLGGR